MTPAELSISLDHSAVDAARDAFDRLKVAIEAVNAELEKLGDKPHGGITISAVGSLVQCEVKPAPPRNSGITEDIINSKRCTQ